MTITISKNAQGWQAVFRGFTDMPNNTPLPLPFTNAASAEMVRNDLRTRFPGSNFVTKAGSRDPERSL